MPGAQSLSLASEEPFRQFVTRELHQVASQLVAEYERRTGEVSGSPSTRQKPADSADWESYPSFDMDTMLSPKGGGSQAASRRQSMFSKPISSLAKRPAESIGIGVVAAPPIFEAPTPPPSASNSAMPPRGEGAIAPSSSMLSASALRPLLGGRVSIESEIGSVWQSTRPSGEYATDPEQAHFRASRGSVESDMFPTFIGDACALPGAPVTVGLEQQDAGECKASFEQQRATKTFEPLPVWVRRQMQHQVAPCASSSMAAFHMNKLKHTRAFGDFTEEEEHATNDKKHAWMLLPSSPILLSWNYLGMLFIILESLTIPLELSSIPLLGGFTIILRLVVCCYWTLAIAVSFRTGVAQDDGDVMTDPIRTAWKYLTSWFIFDAFIVLLDWCTMFGQGSESADLNVGRRAARFLSVVRLLRLLRLSQIPGMNMLQMRSEALYLVAHMGKILGVFVWGVHLVACLWYWAGSSQGERGWVRHFFVDEPPLVRYTWCLRWAMLQLAGEQLIHPGTLEEMWFAVCTFLCFFVASSVFVSLITTSLTKLQILSGQDAHKRMILRRFLVDACISGPLLVRIQRNALHMMEEQRRNIPESNVAALQLVSLPLREELHFEIHSRVLMAHPFFFHYNFIDHAGLRRLCHSAVSAVTLLAQDVLFAEGEVPPAPKMFFVVSGMLEAFHMDEEEALRLGDGSDGSEERGSQKQKKQRKSSEKHYLRTGSWLCEAVLFTSWVHRITVQASTVTKLLALDARRFGQVVGHFHTHHAEKYMKEFLLTLNKHYLDKDNLGSNEVDEDFDDLEDRIDVAFGEDEQLQGSLHLHGQLGDSFGSVRSQSSVKEEPQGVVDHVQLELKKQMSRLTVFGGGLLFGGNAKVRHSLRNKGKSGSIVFGKTLSMGSSPMSRNKTASRSKLSQILDRKSVGSHAGKRKSAGQKAAAPAPLQSLVVVPVDSVEAGDAPPS